jgi:hypothetical protein
LNHNLNGMQIGQHDNIQSEKRIPNEDDDFMIRKDLNINKKNLLSS